MGFLLAGVIVYFSVGISFMLFDNYLGFDCLDLHVYHDQY